MITAAGEETTMRAIFDSYRLDVDLLRSQQKGKQRAGELTDFEFALNLFLADLDETEQLVTDRIMAESLAHAVYTDEAVIAELIDEETQATRDHNFAQQVERRERTGETVVNTSPPSSSSLGSSNGAVNASRSTANDYLDDLDALLTKTDASTPEKLQQAIAERKYTTRVCNTCFERTHFSSSLTTKCGHNFCRSCVCKLFVHATTDESLYPPRCCRHPFPVEKVLGWMKPMEAAKFRKVALEYDAAERTYCFDTKCGAFILDISRDGAVSCPSCKKLTCGRCKTADHGMADCPSDGALKKLLQIAATSGWKRCPKCKAVVERVSGCEHITCKCGSHWCYLCSMPWTGNGHTCRPGSVRTI
ncbi:hypothetical protein EX30DRAFT_336677 [Ascodesmis nigricans]|uniref:RBR-type E3 ubiquitin transferase n=1 Tax=Ascodesmis nigricans TaxID=341454 RepID=A0A4S2MI47_9PEZI|nr:hypothetical protein EX30DRAFT_336677 [Ascodesmis nigricans]